MSIYSGFATRQQEHSYDNLLYDLIQVLQRRIIKFYTGQQADEHKFHQIVSNLHHHLSKMEDNKYLEPKMSNSFRQLLNVTATVDSTYLEMQKQFDISHNASHHLSHNQHHVSNTQGNGSQHMPPQKDSLSFSRDKNSEDFKSNWAIGKIKHQLQAKDDFSSKGETNPEDVLNVNDRRVKRAVSTHFNRNFRKRQLQKKAQNESNWTGDEQRRNMQYIIRQYISKGLHKRGKKKGVE